MSTVVKEFKKSKMVIVGVLAILSYMIITCIPLASFAVLLPGIAKEMKLTSAQAASFSAGVNLGIAALVFVAGVIMDKVSSRVLMCIFSIGCALTIALRAFPTEYGSFYILFPLFGVFLSVIYPGNNKMIALWFPKKHLFVMNALIIAGGAMAFIIGLNFTLPMAAALGGWRNFFIAYGILMCILGLLWVIVVPERSSKDAALNQDVEVKDGEKATLWQNIKHVLASPKVWVLCFAEFFFAGVIGASTSLGTTALYTHFAGALTVQQAASLSSTANIGSLVGYIVLPSILGKFFPKVDKAWPVMISMAIAGVLWSSSYWGHRSIPYIIFALVFGAFWNGFAFAGPRTMLMELPEVAGLRAGTALGVFTTLSRIGNVIVISLAGVLAGAFGGFDKGIRVVYLLTILGAVCIVIFKVIQNSEKKKATAAATANN